MFFYTRPEEIKKADLFAYIFYMKNFEYSKYSIKDYCNTLPVSETGYYKWIKNKDKNSAAQKLLDEHPDNHNYGIERMQLALEQKGIKRSYSTVKRAMQLGNLIYESNRLPDGFTKADKKTQRSENIIDLDFTAELPNQK